jgi:hypothetical protein
MTTGTKSALHSPQVEASVIKYISLVFLLCMTFSQQAHEIHPHPKKFLSSNKIFHHPDKALFKSRAFNLEMFIGFNKDQIKEASLFFRTDSQPRYREISFSMDSERFLYRYNPKENPANYITYFFTVELKSGQVYATPVDSSGLLSPITKNLIDPIKYYKERAEGKS